MKKYIRLFAKAILILIIIYTVYCNTPYYIKKHAWKSFSDAYICCFMKFNEDPNHLELRWPYIYHYGVKEGVVVFCFYDDLYVYSYREGWEGGFAEYTRK